MSTELTPATQQRECIAPTKQNTKTSADVEEMFNSHSWTLHKAEPQSDGKGVLIRMSCKRCGANKVAILQEGDEE
ncbi:MAG: hypothetical protein ACYCQJ_00440 [Nitrososphaerales archaeon]